MATTNSLGMGQTAGELQANYLNLLITQLRNQDPMSPMDNSQMTAQLAQLSQLEQMQNLNSSFSQVLTSQQALQATAMIGKTVSYTPAGATSAVSGTVTGVEVLDGQVWVDLDPGIKVQLDQVTAIR
jgi:flagellar basal-body rod modification protein FlgD